MTENCAHCGNDVGQSVVLAGGESFCCKGCAIVRQNLLELGLEHFYELRDVALTPVGDKVGKKERYAYLDDPVFQKEKFSREGSYIKARFFIEGAHCQACLWVLEQLPENLSFAHEARFSMDTSILEVIVEEGSKLSELAERILAYGYTPHLIFEDSAAKALKLKEKKSALIRVGVAFFCAGNIMLLSVSSYSGLEGNLRVLFDLVSLALCLPAVTYCSLPFYRSTWAAFRNKSFSIDISISFGLVLGFAASAWHAFKGQGDVYFDTLSMLVFLLLGSRYLLDAAREKGLDSSEVKSFFSNVPAKKLLPDETVVQTHSSLLNEGDKILVEPGDIVPVDAIVEEGSSYVNESVLTGESLPVRKAPGSHVYAGGENQGESLRLRALKNASNSKMGEIFQKLQRNWGRQTRMARLSDSFSKGLVIVVSFLALGIFFYFASLGQADVGLQRALAMVIITCPCALGFNIPIGLLLGMRKLAKHGIILKDDLVVENVTAVEKVYLDKTGTITDGGHNISFHWKGGRYEKELFTLERLSKHPLANRVVDVLSAKNGDIQECDYREYMDVPGRGPRAFMDGVLFEVRPAREENAGFALYRDGEQVMLAKVEDSLRGSFAETVAKLKGMGKKVFLLSGDNRMRTEAAANACQGDLEGAYWEKDPIEKEKIVSSESHSLMVGDGVNDALALKAASVGVAASGGVDLALASSDVYFCGSGPELLLRLFEGCSTLMRIIKVNVLLALLYNALFIALALAGKISPLAAAILMPLSSLTLLGATLFMVSRLERALSK